MRVFDDKELYYTRAFRRRDPDGSLQAKMEKQLAAQIERSFEGKRGQEDFFLEELALATIEAIINEVASRGKIFYHSPMLKAVQQVWQYLVIWHKTLVDQDMPGEAEVEQAGAALFMLVLWLLFSDYVIDHPQSPITTLVEIVTESEYAPDVSALITDEPCDRIASGHVCAIYHVPCTVFGDKEKNLLKAAKARGNIIHFHVIDVSDGV